MNLINIYYKNSLKFLIQYRLNRLKRINRLLQFASILVFSGLKLAEFGCMHRDIALSTFVISTSMSDIVNVTSKSVFPLQIMGKINNLPFYHDLDLSRMSDSSLLAIW